VLITDIAKYEVAAVQGAYNELTLGTLQPVSKHPLVFFIGQAGAGKTTHINKLADQGQARLRECKGFDACTTDYSYTEGGGFTMVDTPGYGYDSYGEGFQLIDNLDHLLKEG